MSSEDNSSGRSRLLGLPLWLLILLLIGVVLAAVAVALVGATFINRTDSAAVPTLASTAALPTEISEEVISPTEGAGEVQPTETGATDSARETEEAGVLPPTNTIEVGAVQETRDNISATRTAEAAAAETGESAEGAPRATDSIVELVPTYTPLFIPTSTLSPLRTSTPRPTASSTPTRLPLPTNTRYVPPPPTATPTRPATATPLVTNTPPSSNAWRGEYFNNQDLSGEPSLVRQDPQINFDWGTGSPDPATQSDHFSVRWTRTTYFNSGTYTFSAFSDDGVRIWLDNQLIMDQWHDSTNQTYTVVRPLSAGNHSLRVEYYENLGNASIQVSFETGTAYPQWKGEYFNNQDLVGQPVMVRNDNEISFNWGEGSPSNVIPVDHFSVRWSREAGFNAGDYAFYANSDDGIRAWLDGQLIINEWHDNDGGDLFSAFRSVNSGVHSLRVEYFENLDQAQVQFWWEPVESELFWNGKYYANENLSGSPALTRSDSSVNFFWGTGSPGADIPPDGFSARWDRIFDFPKGTYRIYASVDDGVRVLVDGKVVIDSWKTGGKQNVSADVSLSGHKQVVIEYFEDVETAEIRVWWDKIGG